MTHYDTLQVSRTASTEVIESAYRALMKLHHPDKASGNETYARRLNEAHDVLSDPIKRREYDETLKPKTVRMPPVDQSAYPPAYQPAYPDFLTMPKIDPQEVYDELVKAVDLPGLLHKGLEVAGKNVLGRIVRENPLVGHVLDAALKASKEERKKK